MMKNKVSSFSPYVDVGLQFALAIILSLAFGYWLDKKLHTSPLFLIIGLILGATSGFLTIYHAAYPGKDKESQDQP
jgi:ATP synthase protein I